tara:strand:+ start:177 stop:605 length:429 start_codon:yes stop_codon:yes gene_type:complete
MKLKYIVIIVMCFFLNIGIALADVKMREFRDKLCYDGDTCYVTMPALPKTLSKMTVRILGIDTPELRGKCSKEKELAMKARIFANNTFREARVIEFKDLKWDKYGGRILSNVYLDGYLYADMIINEQLARPYDGGKKEGWCD